MMIIEDIECLTIKESSALLKVSCQTIWRYASERKRPERKIGSQIVGGRYYIPKSELFRFRDEIRPTFKGGPGRPMGSKNKTVFELLEKKHLFRFLKGGVNHDE